MFDRAQASVLQDASLRGVMKATTRSKLEIISQGRRASPAQTYGQRLGPAAAVRGYGAQQGHVPGRVRMRGITPIDEVYEEDPRMRKLFRKHFAIVVRRCAFRDLPADLATHVASFLMPDVAWFLM